MKKRNLAWKLWIAIPTSLVGAGGITTGVLAAVGYFNSNLTKVNINTIFGQSYQWSNNATTPDGTSTQDNDNEGSEFFPYQITPDNDLPSKDALKTNLIAFLKRSSQKENIVNDLNIGTWSSSSENNNVSLHIADIHAIEDSQEYQGNFIVYIYAVGAQNLADVITDHIIDRSTESTAINALQTLRVLKEQNDELDLENVQIGYGSDTSFVEFDDDKPMSQTVLGNTSGGLNLWTNYNIDNRQGYGYSLTIHAIPGGLYDGSDDVTIYLLLQRTLYNDSGFFTDKHLKNWDNNPFDVFPSVLQAQASWMNKYKDYTTPFDYTNFYVSNPNNLEFTIDQGQLKLTYGDANEFYTRGVSNFTIDVKAATALSNVFKNDAGTTYIENDTVSNPLNFIEDPSIYSYQISYFNTIFKLQQRYDSDDWSNFNSADFTSMQIKSITNTVNGDRGTIVIEPIQGSLIYSGDVTITWQIEV